jgi:hypothetical protein
MAGVSIRAILARAMIRYSPELITWRAAPRGTNCDSYSNMIMLNVKLQPSDATPQERAIPPGSHTISTRRTDNGPASVGPLSFKNLARILNRHSFQVFLSDALPLERLDHVTVNV